MAAYGEPGLSTVDAHGLRLGIVATHWHGDLVDHMVARAQEAAKACQVEDVRTVRVMGSVELPVVAQALLLLLARQCIAPAADGGNGRAIRTRRPFALRGI